MPPASEPRSSSSAAGPGCLRQLGRVPRGAEYSVSFRHADSPVVFATHAGWKPGTVTAWVLDPIDRSWMVQIRSRVHIGRDEIAWYRYSSRYLLPLVLDDADRTNWLPPRPQG